MNTSEYTSEFDGYVQAIRNGLSLASRQPLSELVHICDNDGNTLLHHASACGNLRVAETLLANGSLVDARNHEGLTPLHAGVNSASLNVVDYLLASGADVGAKTWKTKRTPLHLVFYNDDVSVDQLGILELLIAAGSDINAPDAFGCTPLLCHLRFGPIGLYLPFLNRLLLAGADLNAGDKNGSTALHIVCQRASIDFHPLVISELLIRGANPQARDNLGKRPIDYLRSAAQENYNVPKRDWKQSIASLEGPPET